MSKVVDTAFFDRLSKAADHARVPLSQAAIGNRVGVDRRTVDRWFNGGLPSPDNLFLIADSFKVDARWLATGRGDMIPSPGTEPSLAPHEEELLQRYRDADSRWRLSLRLLACLATEEQIEAATDVNMVIARIFGKKLSDIRPPSDKRVRAALGDIPTVAARKEHGKTK